MEKKKSSKGVIVMLVVIIVILLALVVLMGMGIVDFRFVANNQQTSENNNVNDMQNDTTKDETDGDKDVSSSSDIVSQKSSVSKSQILSYYKESIAAVNDSNHQYSVIDINNDDIPELFVYVTGMLGHEIVAEISIYTYDENKGNKDNNYIVGIGSIGGRIDNNTSLYKMNDGRLLSVYGHMGYESVTFFKLENDWLIRTDFSSRQTDNYMSGDILIQFKPCSDTSLIDNYS